MAIEKVIIIGGGIAGIASALCLARIRNENPKVNITCTVYEIRSIPSTIGGAINLTPNALRYLEHLGVLSKLQSRGAPVPFIEIFSQRNGAKLGVLSFDNAEKSKHQAMRIQRGLLLDAMLETAKEAGIQVQFGKKVVEIGMRDEQGQCNGVRVRFEDGEVAEGDLLLGCDGIHSYVRSVLELDRKPVYSGIATAYGMFDDRDGLKKGLPFDTTALWSGRRGSLLASWANPEKTRMYVAAVMETQEVASREGWKVIGEDQDAVKANVMERFHNPSVPYLQRLIAGVDAYFLYPVYKLPPHGKWSAGCAILLGDAAHAMPPQGESLGLAIEDTILFTRVLEAYYGQSCAEIFMVYEKLRKPRIDAAFDEANFRWENVRDVGFIVSYLREWMTTLYLWWMKKAHADNMAYDVRNIDMHDTNTKS
ncbi:FAD/NAD(P)-binding domain-containing protein [Rhizodiscina lignyota]|uniref:FAD/NAD(P)-binding domain-containing protein n=1 Tax=Rhizodiscina lignyota TaxID=1504668 RepID=A0A9P4IAP5_9PEZI|nr:FAD/NAD(P)-binding domain-containing protein [Rhizodiscina lignyota]